MYISYWRTAAVETQYQSSWILDMQSQSSCCSGLTLNAPGALYITEILKNGVGLWECS